MMSVAYPFLPHPILFSEKTAKSGGFYKKPPLLIQIQLTFFNVPGGVGVQVQTGYVAGLPLIIPLAANHGGVVFPMKLGFMGAL